MPLDNPAAPSDELGGREEIVEGLELMPDPMYRALEDIVELVVDGDYEELRVVSRDRLGVEDLRRRVEDDELLSNVVDELA